MALPTDEKVYNMSTQYRRRKDLLVAEGPSGELVVMERRTYYPPRLPKPQAVTVLPPPPDRDSAPAPSETPHHHHHHDHHPHNQ